MGRNVGMITFTYLASNVISNFVLIRHLNELNVFAGLFTGFVTIVVPLIPFMLYGNLYRILEYSELFLNKELLALGTITEFSYNSSGDGKRKYWRRYLKSCPALSIKFDNIYAVDRMFILYCGSFVFVQTVNLLLTI